ncbi:putative 2-dehydropantoate 2-reductase [Escovopsis weberi]|uniref:Putative 2-dehydropantoate 2-reductase n=1 Tax=Escovopsis weberi TaxID=150374 RepID=A0A0M9VWC1_ESCWE|nr:putative 2-dehydropantoate 2-reductase [Escovopsis weberi]
MLAPAGFPPGRVASQRYETVTTSTDARQHPQHPPHHQERGPQEAFLGGTTSTTATATATPAQRPWMNPPPAAEPPQAAQTRPAPRYYVPSVLLPAEAAKAPGAHKIFILGDDERSRFIAHALSGVYDSVERLGWRATVSPRYRNLERLRPSNHRGPPKVGPLAVTPRVLARDDDTHIDQLIVTGHGYEATAAMKSVKHRITEDTTVCLMNDGLGVLEDVRSRVFNGTHDAGPTFLLGHMSHKLAFNRAYDSVRELRHGVTRLTMDTAHVRDQDRAESRLNFVRNMQQVQDLKPSLTPYDQWLRFKLPSVIFDSVVEPVCVLLEMPYQGLLQNPAAQRMLHRLLDEIVLVVDCLPEVEGSAVIRDYLRGNKIRRNMYDQILAKRSHPSALVRRIENGLPTDVDYLNGFFLRQGRLFGLDLPAHHLMTDLIKAKQSMAIERLNSYVPMEEISIPSAQHFRYRTSPPQK